VEGAESVADFYSHKDPAKESDVLACDCAEGYDAASWVKALVRPNCVP
jgi:hypothetical protein